MISPTALALVGLIGALLVVACHLYRSALAALGVAIPVGVLVGLSSLELVLTAPWRDPSAAMANLVAVAVWYVVGTLALAATCWRLRSRQTPSLRALHWATSAPWRLSRRVYLMARGR